MAPFGKRIERKHNKGNRIALFMHFEFNYKDLLDAARLSLSINIIFDAVCRSSLDSTLGSKLPYSLSVDPCYSVVFHRVAMNIQLVTR